MILLVTTLVSCGNVRVKNQEWCGDMGELGADCFNTHNSNTRSPTKEQWDEERFGMVCTTAKTFADIKATILKLCKGYKKCIFDTSSNSVSFTNRNDVFDLMFFDKVEEFNISAKEFKERTE